MFRCEKRLHESDPIGQILVTLEDGVVEQEPADQKRGIFMLLEKSINFTSSPSPFLANENVAPVQVAMHESREGKYCPFTSSSTFVMVALNSGGSSVFPTKSMTAQPSACIE